MSPYLMVLGAVIGAVLALIGIGLLRGIGPRFRVARLLATAPEVTIADAVELARAGRAQYVRIHGRIRSEEEFPDEMDRPLVYRRRRVEVRAADGGWRTVTEEAEAVPFGLEDRTSTIALDAARLAEGLVVLPRDATGRASDLLPQAPGADPDAPARQRIEQVSAVEGADAVGVPILDAAGQPLLSSGLGRPLILSMLERPEAMRVLAEGRTARVRAAAALLAAAGIVLVATGLGALAGATGFVRL